MNRPRVKSEVLAQIRTGTSPSAERVSEELLRLNADIRTIEQQLGERNRTGTEGDRLDGEEYWTWRTRAIRAREQLVREYREIKLWDKQRRHTAHELTLQERLGIDNPRDPIEVLTSARYVMRRLLRRSGVQLDNEEEAVIHAIDWLLEQSVRQPSTSEAAR